MMLMHRALRGGNPVAGDVTAPTLSSAVGTTTGSTTATVGATTNEANGTLYVVVTTSATQPSIAQIKAGNDHTGSAAAYDSSQAITTTGAKTFNATGLTASTAYYAHLVHTDASANDSNRLSSSQFTTDASGSFPDPTLVRHTFNSGDTTVTDGVNGDINTSGFTWHDDVFASVVWMDGATPMRSWPSAAAVTPSDLDCTPYEGTHCLRMRYPASNNQTEFRFSVGEHVPDFWLRYWIKVPVGYSHGTEGVDSNNKWLALWTDVYDGSGDVTFQLRERDGGNGSKLVVQDGGVAVIEVDVYNDFIVTPTDRGEWMQLVFRLQPATAPAANNGIIQVWRRWDGESSFTQIYNKTNAIFQQGGAGIHQGYLMGYANAAYVDDTSFLVDYWEISDASLV